jgi:Ni/Fe-hydrogenase subunit HybB-like protein
MCGVALAGGGYSTALLVHILRRERWRAIERGAFLTSMIGYVLVCGGLLLDLGRWYNAWHPAVFWGFHSIMFELFWCVGCYTAVQVVEFGHIFVEKVRAPRLARVMSALYGPLLIVGIVLPTLHQSALGSLYIIAKGRLDPLWWSMLMPLFFLMSSFFVGPATVTVESFLSARAHGRRPPRHVLQQMVRVTGWMMVVYLGLKVFDVWRNHLAGRVFSSSVQGTLFLAELGLVALAAALFVVPRLRRSSIGLVAGSVIAILAVVLNRGNVVFTGMAAQAGGARYVPSWMEVGATVGLVAIGVLVYLFVVENFPILPERAHEKGDETMDGAAVSGRDPVALRSLRPLAPVRAVDRRKVIRRIGATVVTGVLAYALVAGWPWSAVCLTTLAVFVVLIRKLWGAASRVVGMPGAPGALATVIVMSGATVLALMAAGAIAFLGVGLVLGAIHVGKVLLG